MAIALVSQTKLRSTSSRNPQSAPSAVTIPANSVAIMALQCFLSFGPDAVGQLKPLNFSGTPWALLSERAEAGSAASYWAWWYLFPRFSLTAVPDWTTGTLSPYAVTGTLFVLSGAEMPPFLGNTFSNATSTTSTAQGGTFTPNTTGSMMLGQFIFTGPRGDQMGSSTATVPSPSLATPANLWTDTQFTSLGAGGGSFVKAGTNTAGSGISWQVSHQGYSGGSVNHYWSVGLCEVKPRLTTYPFTGWGLPLL
ncbi:hypothetical protein Ssi03_76050 [Sphaerisporangium siamense]|uniref:Uncharacterized protein n=1 Tax=Sphaerisporangium siamense TaxID=795645 RepID=A0A7W7D367_9ACTN|nr:hypothetical protein [Sphaerisporangium siamense]MBB4699286.1 hypothetical protein [Sphaerisporangium siamense]GII89615.1 hypothetical protein Ssi03_76050 [Sphaerisporangium siamense]